MSVQGDRPEEAAEGQAGPQGERGHRVRVQHRPRRLLGDSKEYVQVRILTHQTYTSYDLWNNKTNSKFTLLHLVKGFSTHVRHPCLMCIYIYFFNLFFLFYFLISEVALISHQNEELPNI